MAGYYVGMNCPMPSGSASVCGCPRPCEGGSGWTTEGSSTGSGGSSAPGRPGGMCPSGTGRGPYCIPASAGGRQTAPLSGCSRQLRRRRTPWAWPRALPRRPDQQDTARLRRLLPPLAFTVSGGNTNDCTQFTAVMEAIRVPRMGQGRPHVRPAHALGDKGYSSKAIRTLAATARYRPHHPRAGRPSPKPAPARQPRRAAVGLRQAALHTSQRGGTVLWTSSHLECQIVCT